MAAKMEQRGRRRHRRSTSQLNRRRHRTKRSLNGHRSATNRQRVDGCGRRPSECDECASPDRCEEMRLVRDCVDGHDHAQRRMFELYRSRILSLMIRMTSDRDEAEDLLQDAFMRVLSRIGDFRGESALGTWIHRVAVNEALQKLRRKRRRKRIFDEAVEEISKPVTHHEDPSRRMDVRDAIEELPPSMREMIELRYYDGMTYEEIADELGMSKGTAGARLHKARERLRSQLM